VCVVGGEEGKRAEEGMLVGEGDETARVTCQPRESLARESNCYRECPGPEQQRR
jgi:hypothetical protein